MLRDYQQKSLDDLYAWFAANPAGNPVVCLPTGAGKSHVIAALVKGALTSWPETRVLMLTHTKELIAQNASKMREHWPAAPMGIYSASLKSKNLGEPITFAGIQSIAKRAADLGHIDLAIIDECHAISDTETGNYRNLLAALTAINPALRIIGYTASPYRLGQGMLTDGDSALFTDIIEPVSVEGLIHAGYLSRLRSKHTATTLDTTGVKKQGGDFVANQLEAAVDTDANNAGAVREIIERGADRKSWLVFCVGIDHAQHVTEALQQQGVAAKCLTGKTPAAERDSMITDFKAGALRCLVNINVLSTGFDHPGVDLIAMLRPTLSPGLYMQQAGRGLRIAPGKADCLVLDFAGNVATHGPITAVTPPSKAKKLAGTAPSKVCPACAEICPASARECPACGHAYPPPEEPAKPAPRLRQDDIMGIEPMELATTGWQWRKHTSRSSGKDMLACTFYGDPFDPPISCYYPVLHDGYAGSRARLEVAGIANQSGAVSAQQITGDNLDEFAETLQRGNPPALVKYFKDGKFYRVTERIWTPT